MCEAAVSESSTEQKERSSSSRVDAWVPEVPKTWAAVAVALSLARTRERLASEHDASVLHWVNTLHCWVCACSDSTSTRFSQRRQTQVGAPSCATFWMTIAVRCEAARCPPYSSCSCSACRLWWRERTCDATSFSRPVAASAVRIDGWASSTGCCTPTQKRTPPAGARIGVMKSRLTKREPSFR